MIEVGMVIGGRLRVDQLLGAGGMGVVAAATHLELGHRVAVKVLRDELAQSPTLVERFIREARAVVALRTEHVCRVLDVGRLDSGAPYIMMELLEGADLARAIAQRPLPVPIAVEYIVQACVAIAEAHAAGVIHRDLKPANLFVTRRRDGGALVKVLDFGIAKAITAEAQLTHGSGMLGSPGYMSPEQLQSPRDVDARTDIWALGVTLYQLVSGRNPFFAASPMEVAMKVASDAPAPLDVDPALAAVIVRCLEKDRARRYPDVRSLVADLARFGGPGAMRAAAELEATASGERRAASARPQTAPIAATAATAASYAPADHGAHPLAASRSPLAPSRGWIWIVAGAAIAAAGVAIAVVASRGSSSPAVAPARDAAVVRTADAAAPTPPDAAPPPPPPADAAPPPADAAKTKSPIGPENFPHLDDLKKACRQSVKTPYMLQNAAGYVTYCYCILGEVENAKRLAKTLSKTDLESAQRGCDIFHIDL